MRKAERAHSVRREPAFDIVAFAASAGGVFALTEILGRLPAGFPAIVVVVQHLDPRHRSLMPQIFGRRSILPVYSAVDGMEVQPGAVYLAPPDRHLLINRDGIVSLTQTELVNFVRPSATCCSSRSPRRCARTCGRSAPSWGPDRW